MQVYRNSVDDGNATLQEIADGADVPAGIFEPTAAQLTRHGYLSEADGHYRFTGQGTDTFTRLVGAWRVWLLDSLADEPTDPNLSVCIDEIAEQLISNSRDMSDGRHAIAVASIY